MLPRISLLEELKKGGYESSLITTFNAYLPFYEEVVLRRLVTAGVRRNVLMMDGHQYAAALGSHPPRLAGRRYTLIPMNVTGAFHPKLIFLAGKRKGLVAIGSHNLTISGFGFNRELTNVVRIDAAQDPAGTAFAHRVWTEVEYWLKNFAENVPGQITDMAGRIRDSAPWLKGADAGDDSIELLAGRPGDLPLWDQFTALITGVVKQVQLSGAFFDRKLTFLDRVMADLKPQKLTVAVDPRSVDVPVAGRARRGISFVRADGLGEEHQEGAGSQRYLHAKAIFVQQKNGMALFASGSANPSRPAWMARAEDGNVELMLVRRGEDALTTAQKTGFSTIADMPALDDADWATIKRNAKTKPEAEPPPYRSGLAVVKDDHVFFSLALLDGKRNPKFILVDEAGREIAQCRGMSTDGELAVVKFKDTHLWQASSMECHAGKLTLRLLLHHMREVEEQARTGTQRRFKEALLSLDTDTPNIELLIQCIDKIVFSENETADSITIPTPGPQGKVKRPDSPDTGTLAIDIQDTKKGKAKSRLNHSGDFAYLLDTLIYHLRFHEDRSIEELDQLGRNEEEQVGSDDDQDTVSRVADPDRLGALLDLCHKKVRTVVNRMIGQLDAYSNDKQSLKSVLVRLLAVLAVLRELRHCDGRVPWVEKGRTTVPTDQRLRLLDAVMHTLFEGRPSLLHIDALGEEIEHSDDLARLKGLVLWLAWDCGLTLDLHRPFMESPEDQRERLRGNAMVLALAQMIQSDHVVIDEARQSIGSLTTSEMDWLKEVQWVADQCDVIRKDDSLCRPSGKAQPGDIALHRSIPNWDLRVVLGSGPDRVFLVRLSKDNPGITYTQEHISVARLAPGASEPAGP
jgi:hypothetical protein